METLQKAHIEKWAMGQFNMSIVEVLKAIVKAANDVTLPLIVGVSPRTLAYVGLPYMEALVKVVQNTTTVPVYFHLDHGKDLAAIETCINIGFDSVMIDASNESLEGNIEITQKVVKLAHAKGVGVEAQIGTTWNAKQKTCQLTDPVVAGKFVEVTGIDYLAISVGETPGSMDKNPEIDLGRIQEISNVVSVPLVLHGGTSVSDALIKRAIQMGVAKINVDTAIRVAVTKAVVNFYRGETYSTDLRACFSEAEKAVEAVVARRASLFHTCSY